MLYCVKYLMAKCHGLFLKAGMTAGAVEDVEDEQFTPPETVENNVGISAQRQCA